MRPRQTSRMIWLVAVSSTAGACSSTSRPGSPAGAIRPMPTVDIDAASPPAGSPDADGLADAPSTDGTGSEVDTMLGDGQANDSPSTDGLNPPSPRCDPVRSWGSTARVPSVPEMTTFARFGGVSIDELTIAWTSAGGSVYVADRAAPGDVFRPPSTPSLDPTSMPVANDRVALGPSGTLIVAVSPDRSRFLAFNRIMVGTPWVAAATLQFAKVNAMAAADGVGQFSEPVLGADDRSLYYLLASPGASPVLYESTWDPPTHAWTTGVALLNSAPDAGATLRRRATAASSDGRTLFFFDEAIGQQRAAWRETPASPFVQFVNLTGLSEATPNYLCNTLYFRGVDSDSGTAGPFIAQ
jgi:hypothetical protein